MSTEEMVKILEEILKLMDKGNYDEARIYLEILIDLLKKEIESGESSYEEKA